MYCNFDFTSRCQNSIFCNFLYLSDLILCWRCFSLICVLCFLFCYTQVQYICIIFFNNRFWNIEFLFIVPFSITISGSYSPLTLPRYTSSRLLVSCFNTSFQFILAILVLLLLSL